MKSHFSGEELQSLRLAAGLDIVVLARRVCLSPAQIRELENNQGSLFYTPAIRDLAARKVAAHLRRLSAQRPVLGDPAQVNALVQALPASAESDDELILFDAPPRIYVRESKLEEPLDAFDSRSPRQGATRAATAWREGENLCLATGGSNVSKSQVRWSLMAWLFSVTVVVVLAAASVTGSDKATILASDPSISRSAWLDARVSDLLATPEFGLTDETSTSARTVDAQGSDLRESDLVAMAPLAAGSLRSSPQLPTSVLNTPRIEHLFSCPEMDIAAPEIFLPSAIAQGRAIHLASRTSQTVCVLDGAGRTRAHHLEPDQPKSITGPPPWTIQASSLNQMQIYFQGTRLAVPPEARERIRLIEPL